MQPVFTTFVVDDNLLENIYDVFFNEIGYIILKNIFSEEIMDEYNLWCNEHFVEILNTHINFYLFSYFQTKYYLLQFQ